MGSAASTMDSDLVAPEARLIHVTGITPALSPGCARMVRQILDQRPRQVSFDVNFRPGLWSVAEAAPVLADLANRAAVVFVGRDEAAILWGTDTCDDIRDLLPEPAVLVVKDAAAEAVSFGPAGRVAVPAQKVDVVEPVGAGDAFAAGYLFGLLGSHDEPVRLSLGHLVAATALGSTSDHGRPPDPTELLALAHQHVEATRGKPR